MDRSLDVISILKNDHETLRKLLDELSATSNRANKKRHELLDKVVKELKVHTQLEEEIVYPALKKAGHDHETDQMYYEAREEHRAVEKLVIPDLEKTDVSTDQFAGRVKVLKEMVEHHVEEEESEMFPKMEALFSDEQRAKMGEMLNDRRRTLH